MELDKLSPTLNKSKQGKIGFNPERDVEDKSLPYSKLQLSGKITNSDIAADAAIAISKTALGNFTNKTALAVATTWKAATADPVLNNGTFVGYYQQLGKLVRMYVAITMGAGTTYGTGTWKIMLPVTAGEILHTCPVVTEDAAVGTFYDDFLVITDPNFATFLDVSLSSYWQNNIPQTWASGDKFYFNFWYFTA